MQPIHDRMPVILDGPALARWLTPGPLTADEAAGICAPFDPDQMAAVKVSSVVNSARNDVPECVVPAGSDLLSGDLFTT
jgi:putative SOS response-associated peptidase YedK